MRSLFIMRGVPGSGKSTFIKKHNLEPYTLSADTIRLMYQTPVLSVDGTVGIPTQNDTMVWKTLFEMLESRMQQGCFTIIDATHGAAKEMRKYKDLCDKYRYRIYCIDMTDVPMETCIERNAAREDYKRVSQHTLDKMYGRCSSEKVPSGIKVIKPEEFEDVIRFDPISLDEYNNVHIFGDIHGCYTPLNEYMSQNYSDNDFYIFCGDYFDRGTENAEVAQYISSIKDNNNVLLLEGNHERHINHWVNDMYIRSREFTDYTVQQLEAAGFTRKDGKALYRKLAQCAYFTFGEQKFFVSHGGISNMPKNLIFTPSKQFVYGVGKYEDYKTVAESWLHNVTDTILVNGHRNIEEEPICVNDRCYNLEGKVELGGSLRILRLSRKDNKCSIDCIAVKNTVPIAEHLISTNEKFNVSVVNEAESSPITNMVDDLRKNPYILEKKFGNISSFNFSRDAFQEGVWDYQTVRARGLYIDTVQNKVFARGYQKWFRLNEREETQLENLKDTLVFPVKVYQKENGYLGLISYDYYNDDLFFTTKSNPDGDYAQNFKTIFESMVPEIQRESLRYYLAEHNVTLAYEIIDPVFDPHIIEYKAKDICLLDIINNSLDEFSVAPYEEVKTMAAALGINYKKRLKDLNSWEEFLFFTEDAVKTPQNWTSEEFVEGYVLEDSNGFMLKLKTNFYNDWKRLRGVAASTLRAGEYKWVNSLITPLEKEFYAWLQSHYKEYASNPDLPRDIISLRNKFLGT